MPQVERTAPFEQIATHYRERIRSGELRPGDVIPPVREIAESWGVANATAFRAVSDLRDNGWIDTQPRRPTVVASSTPENG